MVVFIYCGRLESPCVLFRLREPRNKGIEPTREYSIEHVRSQALESKEPLFASLLFHLIAEGP